MSVECTVRHHALLHSSFFFVCDRAQLPAVPSTLRNLCSTDGPMRGMFNSWLAWAAIALIRRRW